MISIKPAGTPALAIGTVLHRRRELDLNLFERVTVQGTGRAGATGN